MIKTIICKLIHMLAINRLLFFLISILNSRRLLVAFSFHRVVNQSTGKIYYLNYDRGLDITEFDIQIKSIAKYFDVVNLEKFIAILKGNIEPKRHTALITFDDSDSEFADNAFPILQKYNCPAVIFSPTLYIDSAERFWHLRISNAFENLTPELWDKIRKRKNAYPEPVAKIIELGTVDTEIEKISTCQKLVNTLDKYKQPEIDRVIDKLEEIIGRRYTIGIQCLSWQQQQMLSDQGIHCDSHTVSHRKLAELSDDEIESELTDSKAEMEKRLEKKVLSICYPAGSYDNRVIKLAAQCGYETGFTTRYGLCKYPLKGSELYNLPRMIINGSNKYDVGLFISKIALSGLLGIKYG